MASNPEDSPVKSPNLTVNKSENDSENDSDVEKSDNDLEIDLNQTLSPQKHSSSEKSPSKVLSPQKASSPIPEKIEQDIIETIEHELGKKLSEKAEKNNLTVTNVKTIIRQILTNEHVRAFIGKEDLDNSMGTLPYEPKLTRAKAKELISSTTSGSPVQIPWVPKPPPSETHVLIGEDLREDDSGDEYVPGEEESEDDRDESIASESDVSSLPPPTPPTLVSMEDHATQTTSYTDDGVFKIPLPITTQEETTEEAVANIALRTRSKINLSGTPLEVIEKKFVPPDITTDMYDTECDDDEWRDFLKGFTEPLEEVTKPTEDEEHDPEYNILADDEINQVDNEDFRMDKAVKISKKEVRELWDELFEYLHNISEEYEDQNNQTQDTINRTIDEQSSLFVSQEPNESQVSEMGQVDVSLKDNNGSCIEERNKNKVPTPKKKDKEPKGSLGTNNFSELMIAQHQLPVLEQQIRQHVQMLTQNFVLTYENPEFHHHSIQINEYLLNMKYLSEGKAFSYFRPVNLIPALKLVESWINLFATNSAEVVETKMHVKQELEKSLHYKQTGSWTEPLTFPKLVLETISKSNVFLYPWLLPKIPFKSEQCSETKRSSFLDAEERLLVFELDMFQKYLMERKKCRSILNEAVALIQEYMMPLRNVQGILKHIWKCKHPRCATNPIQRYFLYKEVKPFVHYIYTLNQVLPPCKKSPQELPIQWRNFIYPELNPDATKKNVTTITSFQAFVPQQIIVINSPQLTQVLTSPVTIKTKKPRKKRKPNSNNRKLGDVSVKDSNASNNSVGNLTDTPNLQLPKSYQPRRIEIRNQATSPERNNSIFISNDSLSEINFQKVKSTDLNNINSYNLTQTPTKNNSKLDSTITSIDLLVAIFLQPLAVQKLVRFLTEVDLNNHHKKDSTYRAFVKIQHSKNSNMLPNMPSLSTSLKNTLETVDNESAQNDPAISSDTVDSTVQDEVFIEKTKENVSTEHKKPETVTSSTVSQEISKEKCTKNLEFSTIISSSFQQDNNSSEVEFYRNSSNIQICQTSQSHDLDIPSSSGYVAPKNVSEKDNPEDINALLVASSTVKPNVRKERGKELSGAVKKKNKLRKDFLANLSIATPEDPESIKHKNEMFAVAYYDKLRETLELEDYHKVMQILNDFESGDVIDLYKDIQPILHPKYEELAEEFLFFLRRKEAAAVGQLIPWLEVQTRSKFLRKLEIYFKDQPAQLRKIYNCLMELTQTEDLTMEKIKSILLPLLKGNTILIDLFLQNFRDERPPPSLLEGPYEKIDVFKELASPESYDKYETFRVPNTEDKYGGQNCICHCHKIEDNEYKSRYKHCKSCGLRFSNGLPLLQSGTGFKPAIVTFELNPNGNHNARLLGKTATVSSCKKKRSDSSPSKQVNSSGKENLDEDTEDEDLGKRKRSVSQRTPRKRKKTDQSKYQDVCKPSSPKKSPARSSDSTDIQKDNIKPRKRTYSGKRSKKEDSKNTENEVEKVEETEVEGEKEVCEDVEIIAELDDSNHEPIEEQQDKTMVDDCMDSSGESIEKPLTPGQQTAESESEIYLEESSQDNYESDDSSSSTESAKGSQSDSNTNDESPWKREEDTIILETCQREDDKEYAFKIISDKLPNRTISQIRNRLSTLMALLIETLNYTDED